MGHSVHSYCTYFRIYVYYYRSKCLAQFNVIFIYVSKLILSFNFHPLSAFIVIGWESPVYNVNEDSGQVEICAEITTPPSDVELEFDDLLLLVSTEDISAG